MRLYVAGPMSNYPAYNVAAFDAAADKWTALGHEVVTPFEANSVVWQRHRGRPFNPYMDNCDYGDPILSEMFAEDVRVLASCDGIVLLEGWEKSKGASTEYHIARTLGKVVFLNATGKQYTEPDETILQEAQRLVHGDRGEAYGHPLDDFTRTAKIWSAILGIDVSPEQVGLCMVGVKISRECNAPKRDNRTDGAGYFETVDMIHAEKKKRGRLC